jgi:hypothetical protein
MTFVVLTKSQHKPKTPQAAASTFAIVCATCGETQYFGSDQANAMLTAREIHISTAGCMTAAATAASRCQLSPS